MAEKSKRDFLTCKPEMSYDVLEESNNFKIANLERG
jgi:hypothetical protein